MKKVFFILLIALTVACGKSGKKPGSIELIEGPGKQDSIYRNLVSLTNNSIPQNQVNDSLAFLILPVQASCPSCRKKTIDSIIHHQEQLVPKHFIIISAKAGRKTINGYFREEDADLPVIENKLFLDSINQAYKYDLYKDKPTMYYTYKQKAYKKVAAIPSTVREDLREFFSGYRIDEHNH